MIKRRAKISISILALSVVLFGASCGTPSDGGVFKSEDQGETWAQKVFVAQQKKKVLTIADVNVEGFYFDPANSDIVYMASKTGGIYKSENAGEQWTQLPTGATRVRDISIDKTNTAVIYSVRSTNIIKSVDAGAHWDTVYTDPQGGIISQVEVDWFQPLHVVATTSIGTVLVSEDAGVNWKVVFQAEEPLTQLFMDPTDSRILYMLELERDVYKSTDGGLTWVALFTDEFRAQENAADVIRSLVMDPNDPHVFYSITPEGIYKSTDSCTTWAYVPSLIAKDGGENNSILNFTVEPGNSLIWYFTIGQVIHKTTDGAATWKTIENFPSGRKITALGIGKDHPEVLYAGTELIQKKKGFFQ